MKTPQFKIPDIKLPDFPKPVALSLAAIGASLVLFLILALTLGVVLSSAETDVAKLKSEIDKIQRNVRQSKDDYDFILANQKRFDTLMASDKLIPHTRRTAIRQMQALALEFGLTSLNYNFQSAGDLTRESAAAQPKSDDYRVYVESIELTVGSPLDKNIYSFIAAAHDDFPGSMILSEAEIERAGIIGNEALNQVSRGEDSGLVKGKLKYSWRTAQQNKQDEKK